MIFYKRTNFNEILDDCSSKATKTVYLYNKLALIYTSIAVLLTNSFFPKISNNYCNAGFTQTDCVYL